MSFLERIAVTGGTGFVGRHLIRALVTRGCQPLLWSPRQPVGAFADLGDRVRWVRLDVRDERTVQETLAREAPDAIIHLAGTRGQSGAGGVVSDCVEVNIVGTVRMLEAAALAGVERVVSVGSAEEYGDQAGPLHEGLPLEATTPYGISKAAATRLALAMHRLNGAAAVVLRPFTVYGPGQPADMFIAQAILSAVHGTPFKMTHGWQRRDLVYVDDVVRALMAAVVTPHVEGRVMNVGSGRAYRLRDVAELIWRLSGSTAPLCLGERPAGAGELHDTWADITLARDLLGWQPTVDLETGLRATIAQVREEHSALVGK